MSVSALRTAGVPVGPWCSPGSVGYATIFELVGKLSWLPGAAHTEDLPPHPPSCTWDGIPATGSALQGCSCPAGGGFEVAGVPEPRGVPHLLDQAAHDTHVR